MTVDLLRMLAHRARCFPSYPMGYHMPEVFAAIGEQPPEPPQAPAEAHEGPALADTLRGIAEEHSIELTEEARRALDRAAELIAAKRQSDAVPMPTNAGQAAAMALLGERWLRDNAPERLRESKAQPKGTQDPRIEKLINDARQLGVIEGRRLARDERLSAPAPAPEGWASGLGLAVIGRRHFGNPIPREWYAAAKELLEKVASTQCAAVVDGSPCAADGKRMAALAELNERFGYALLTENGGRWSCSVGLHPNGHGATGKETWQEAVDGALAAAKGHVPVQGSGS